MTFFISFILFIFFQYDAGFNFDAISCESCKAFFRRNALQPPVIIKIPNSFFSNLKYFREN